MKVVKKIGVLSFAKINSAVWALMGLVFVVPLTLVYSLFGISSGLGASLGVLMFLIIPIMYAVMGFLVGALGAFLYNLVAKRIGGIELDLEELSMNQETPMR